MSSFKRELNSTIYWRMDRVSIWFNGNPFPIASDEKTGSFTEERLITLPEMGLTIVSDETFVCVDSTSVDIGSVVATFEELTGVCSAISSALKIPAAFVLP